MKLSATRVAALSLVVALAAQAQSAPHFSDPANLQGERVKPHNGRELPIDTATAPGALALQQVLRKLNTRASLMLIVAHPDDEDGGMLTLLSRGLGARVATLTLTRGEGGQNAMTGDFEDALGLIRTQELLAADRYFGADQMFGTEVDFGFSKTKQEAFRKWTHQRVLYDAVRAVRLYRPLVIAAVFIGGVTDGHGQHQVSGEIAQEVFRAAADPTVFPELTREGILPWAPRKVYARVPSFAIQPQGLFDYATNQYVPPSFTNYVTGVTSSTPPTADVVLHEGQNDPLLTTCAASRADLASTPDNGACQPLSYVQFARIGLGLQRTQIGPNVRLATSGAFNVGYHLYGSRLCGAPASVALPGTHTAQHCSPVSPVANTDGQSDAFFTGVDTSLGGIATLSSAPPTILKQGLDHLTAQLTAATRALNPSNPGALAPTLVAAQHDLGALLDTLEHTPFPGRPDVLHELRIKQVQLNEALEDALGLSLSASAPANDVLPGSNVPVQTSLTSAAGDPAGLFAESLDSPAGTRAERLLSIDTEPTLDRSHPYQLTLQSGPVLTSTVTRPYFSRKSIEDPVYQVSDPQLRSAPATPAPLTAWATLRYHQTEVRIGRIAEQDHQAVNVVPPASILPVGHAQVLATDQDSLSVDLTAIPASLHVDAAAPPAWRVEPAPTPDGAPASFKRLSLHPPDSNRQPFVLRLTAELPGMGNISEGFRPVGYPGLVRTNYFIPATDRIVPTDLTLPARRRIAYLPGTGDAVADNLRSIGLDVTSLRVSDLTPDHLAHFDTVILGVRTYNAHPDLHGAPTAALLDFARSGGNVIVQYQTNEFTAADAPFPLTLGYAEKVIDESTPVHLLTPPGLDATHLAPDQQPWRALLSPNRITPADFNGWIEERGHGFLQSWDPHYTALTETHDGGAPAEHVEPQQPQRGGLITTSLGRGHWTYVAFALYRQLPEAVPGAYRLFANLIALADSRPTN